MKKSNQPSKKQQFDLFTQAKEAYYEGKPIMSDQEFDKLEEDLGLENKSEIGSKSKNYTVKHPFIMGSLSKIQIKTVDPKSDGVDWESFAEQMDTYIVKANNPSEIVTSPKLDGCSFEIQLPIDKINGMWCFDSKKLIVSTRGDGQYGKDITPWFISNAQMANRFFSNINYLLTCCNVPERIYDASGRVLFVVRGEILIKKSVFTEKYPDFTNPRSFVAGTVNTDFENTEENICRACDLDWIAYDFRYWLENEKTYIELDFTQEGLIVNPTQDCDGPEFIMPLDIPEMVYHTKWSIGNFGKLNPEDFSCRFKHMYESYDKLRQEYDYALDGIVIKPSVKNRIFNIERPRPIDSVAIKFLPEIVETEIEDISWKVGKTGELYPTAICKDVILDGKTVNRASLHNYNYLLENTCGIGSKILISLAGDIIPFVYKVLSSSEERKLPVDAIIEVSDNSGVQHLMMPQSEEERRLTKFKTSVNVLKVDGIGEKIAEELFELFDKELENLIELMPESSLEIIEKRRGLSKSTTNIINSLRDKRSRITPEEIIESIGHLGCGTKCSKQCANYISGKPYDFTGLNAEAYKWVFEKNNSMYTTFEIYCELIGLKPDEITVDESFTLLAKDAIPVIMTGSPKEITEYSTKDEFIDALFPKYRETTSWKEAKILFTNDMSSMTSKMKKAEKLGIEIRTYDQA